MPSLTEEDSKDKEDLPTVDLDDPVLSKEPLLDSREFMCIHEILRPATPSNQPPPQAIPATPPPQVNQESPVIPSLQPDQVEMPPDYELMDLDIPEDIPDLLDIPEDMISDFDAWVQDVSSYQLDSMTIYIIKQCTPDITKQYTLQTLLSNVHRNLL